MPRALTDRRRTRTICCRGPNVIALDRADGSDVWRTTVGSYARILRPLVAGPENLYALYWGDRNREQKVYVIDRSDCTVKGSFGQFRIDPPREFAVADGTLYTHRRRVIEAWE